MNKFVPRPPVPAVRAYTVLSPRGERIPTVLRTYKHHAFRRVEHLDGEVTTESVFCEVFAGGGACEHGWSFEEDEMMKATPAEGNILQALNARADAFKPQPPTPPGVYGLVVEADEPTVERQP